VAAALPNRKDRSMKISARNQIAGTVAEVREGAVNGIVVIESGCTRITADITMEAIRELGLEAGKPAIAVIKASNVMIAAGSEKLALSARNQFAGKVVKVEKGAVNGRVSVECACGKVFSASITNEAIDQLGLTVGAEAVAVVKSTDVLVAVED
jgi:molybdate transport system regulatory protein